MINLCIRRTPFKLFIGLMDDSSGTPSFKGGFNDFNPKESRIKFLWNDEEYKQLITLRNNIIIENGPECEKQTRITNKLIEDIENSVEVYPVGTVAMLRIGSI